MTFPDDGVTVRLICADGVMRDGYRRDGVWMTSQIGPDTPIDDAMVTAWEPMPEDEIDG